MTDKPRGHKVASEPSGGGHEGNANVHVEIKPEFKKRPEMYPEAGKQLGRHDTKGPEKSG